MSIHNRYADVPLTEEDFTTFDAQFAVIEEIMGALQEPNSLILRRVAKLGFKSDTFTRDALILAAQHEDLLPRGLEVQELEAQIRLRDELKSRALQMKLMARKMEKIVQLLGSDVFSGALAAYKAMKANHRGTLNEQLRELGQIFRKRRKGAGEEVAQESGDDSQKQSPLDEPAAEGSVTPQGGARDRLSHEDSRLDTSSGGPVEAQDVQDGERQTCAGDAVTSVRRFRGEEERAYDSTIQTFGDRSAPSSPLC